MQEIKDEIKGMQRPKKAGNLYKINKPQRPDKRIVESRLELNLHPALRQHERVRITHFSREKFRRGLNKERNQIPYPVSPKIGPYVIENPMFGAKNYYWCSCGMSNKQPFCDSSHAGTEFKPLKFSLDVPQDKMFVCGCKLSRKAPFCDGETCISMLKGEKPDIKPKAQRVEGDAVDTVLD